MFLEHELAMGKVGQPGAGKWSSPQACVRSAWSRGPSVGPAGIWGPELQPAAREAQTRCSGSPGVGTHLSHRRGDWPVSTHPVSAFLGEHRCCSVTKSRPTLCDPMDGSTPGFPVLHHLRSLLKLMSTESVMPFNHLILCHPLLLPSDFLSFKVFSSESAFCIRWPKCWNFGFGISPSNEYSGLISFRIDWFDVLAIQWKS